MKVNIVSDVQKFLQMKVLRLTNYDKYYMKCNTYTCYNRKFYALLLLAKKLSLQVWILLF